MHKVAILVTYRDRSAHLKQFLPGVQDFLLKKNINYKIFILEQTEHKPFNKGKLYNCGYVEAKKEGVYSYFITHDVDAIPIDLTLDYGPTLIARQIYSPHIECLGGLVAAISMEHFERVNGFSNEYWGWGFEDDDLKIRFINCGLTPDYSATRFRTGDKDLKEMQETKEKDGYLQLGHIHALVQQVKDEEGIDLTNAPEDEVMSKLKKVNRTKHLLDEFKQNPHKQWESGLNNLQYCICDRKMLSDNVELIVLDI